MNYNHNKLDENFEIEDTVNSYWINFFSYYEKEALNIEMPYKYKLIVDYLFELSRQSIRLEANIEFFDEIQNGLRNVHFYFNDEKFVGILLDFNINDHERGVVKEFEAFYRLKKVDKSLKNNKYLERFEISTEIDYKELRFKNYASIMDVNDKVTLLILFAKTEKKLMFEVNLFDDKSTQKR
jgi:hypothetical protein